MGNNAAAGHVLAATGLPQAVGFHKTLGQMMYQYGIQPWDPKPLLQASLQRQQELQKTSPLRFIQVDDGLRFYGSQMGGAINQLTGVQVLNREKFVEMSMSLFKMKGLHLPVEEAMLFFDIFDSIDLYKNAQLSLGELAGGLSSFFGGTNEAKTNAVFDLMAAGKDQIPKSTLQEFLKPYVWCMVPSNAEVLRPVLLPHIAEEIYKDMSFGQSGYITRTELQRWAQKGQFSQGEIQEQHASMSFTIIDRAALAINIALRVAWREYSEKYELQQYGKQTWTQNYGDKPQYATDVGMYRSGVQAAGGVAPTVTTGAATVFQTVGAGASNLFQAAGQGVNNLTTWFEGDASQSVQSCAYARRPSERRLSVGTTTLQVVQPQPSSPVGLAAPAMQAAPQQIYEAPPPAPPQPVAQVVQQQTQPNLFGNIGQLQPVSTMQRPAQQIGTPGIASFQTRAPLPASVSMQQPMTMAQPAAYQQGGYTIRR